MLPRLHTAFFFFCYGTVDRHQPNGKLKFVMVKMPEVRTGSDVTSYDGNQKDQYKQISTSSSRVFKYPPINVGSKDKSFN